MQEREYSDAALPCVSQPQFQGFCSLGAKQKQPFRISIHTTSLQTCCRHGDGYATSTAVSINKQVGARGWLLVVSGSGEKGRASAAAQEGEHSILLKRLIAFA